MNSASTYKKWRYECFTATFLHWIIYLQHRWPRPILAILFRPFCFIAPKHFYIILFTNLSIFLSVPDEGYSRNVLCTLNLISMFLLQIKGFCTTIWCWSWSTYNIKYRICTTKINRDVFSYFCCATSIQREWKTVRNKFV